MTATAQRAHEEFREFYGLHIAVIPSNKTCIRKDLGCAVYATKKDKISAIINEIIESHKEKRPVLVGTESVKDSEEMADILISKGISCEVLNAKNDEHEAKIIAQAGKLGAITISTNMAGRGTDIRLGGDDELEKKQVAQLGGLYVIGAAKYESRRIDDQLRGRAGRQGDPGACRFFISLDDDLFIKYRLRDLLPVRHLSADAAEHPANIGKAGLQASHFLRPGEIKNPFVNKEIDRVQRIIEGQNFEIKKTLWNYTYLIERQRQILFEKRSRFMDGSRAMDIFKTNAPDDFAILKEKMARDTLITLCKCICLGCMDVHWSGYLAEVTDIREGIHLRRIGGQNPLFEFQKIVIDMFDTLSNDMEKSMKQMIHEVAIGQKKSGLFGGDFPMKSPSSTWTYMINDNPFDPMLEIQLGSSVGVSAWAAMLWPLMAVYFIVKKMKRGKS
jgi:preprotein translocase subunit SecA